MAPQRVAGAGLPVYSSAGRIVGHFDFDDSGRLWLVKTGLSRLFMPCK